MGKAKEFDIYKIEESSGKVQDVNSLLRLLEDLLCTTTSPINSYGNLDPALVPSKAINEAGLALVLAKDQLTALIHAIQDQSTDVIETLQEQTNAYIKKDSKQDKK